jgi:hypothetical protein
MYPGLCRPASPVAALARSYYSVQTLLGQNPDDGMTLLPLQLLVIPKCFFLQLFDIDETPVGDEKCPPFALNFRWRAFHKHFHTRQMLKKQRNGPNLA